MTSCANKRYAVSKIDVKVGRQLLNLTCKRPLYNVRQEQYISFFSDRNAQNCQKQFQLKYMVQGTRATSILHTRVSTLMLDCEYICIYNLT